MPKELKTEKEFKSVIDRSIECRVFKQKNYVKIKLRTKNRLYTYKTSEDKLNNFPSNKEIIIEVHIRSINIPKIFKSIKLKIVTFSVEPSKIIATLNNVFSENLIPVWQDLGIKKN